MVCPPLDPTAGATTSLQQQGYKHSKLLWLLGCKQQKISHTPFPTLKLTIPDSHHGPPAAEPRSDRKDFAFPQEAPGGSQLQKAQAISVLHEVTQHTFQLFSTESSAAAWDQSLLDKLCAALDQQLTDLQACLRQEEELRGAPLLKEDSSLAVRKYFHRITLYL
ncbi:hypothetical protein R6Z07F_002582 [Ovis aries]